MNHIYRHYESMNVAICLNCTKFKHEIEAHDHYVFESGYCDPRYCPRCKAEECVPFHLQLNLSII